IAAIGLALDALLWSLPHHVVWRLHHRLSHKIAITAIFSLGLLNIVIGGLRLCSFTEDAYRGDVTYGMGTTMIWAITQISTGFIVACCPHLRPLFEKILPRRLTRMDPHSSTPHHSPTPCRERQASVITVTTEIHVRSASADLPIASMSQEWRTPWAATFDVERRPTRDLSSSTPDCECCLSKSHIRAS
ncbi:hypothetical protein DE146DRAFT_783032, partial [Phaeosphaeria sp. MPI-PUGE-AT-0046c]